MASRHLAGDALDRFQRRGVRKGHFQDPHPAGDQRLAREPPASISMTMTGMTGPTRITSSTFMEHPLMMHQRGVKMYASLAQVVTEICQGTNSFCPYPCSSLFEGRPTRTEHHLKQRHRPLNRGRPSIISPQLRSISSSCRCQSAVFGRQFQRG